MTDENETMNEAQANETSVKSCTIVYPNGVTKIFNDRGKSFTEFNVNDAGVLIVNVYFNQVDDDGQGIMYVFTLDTANPENFKRVVELAGRGASSYIKDALCSAQNFEDTLDDKGEILVKGLFSIANNKIFELESGKLVYRSFGQGTLAALTKLELAYARLNKLDVNSPDDYKTIHKWYSGLSKEQRGKPAIGDPLRYYWLEVDSEQEQARSEQRRLEKLAKLEEEKARMLADTQ